MKMIKENANNGECLVLLFFAILQIPKFDTNSIQKKIHNIFIESSVLRKYQSIKENEENVKLTEKIIIINWEMLCCMWEIIENVSGETELKISEFSYYCRYTYVSTHN